MLSLAVLGHERLTNGFVSLKNASMFSHNSDSKVASKEGKKFDNISLWESARRPGVVDTRGRNPFFAILLVQVTSIMSPAATKHVEDQTILACLVTNQWAHLNLFLRLNLFLWSGASLMFGALLGNSGNSGKSGAGSGRHITISEAMWTRAMIRTFSPNCMHNLITFFPQTQPEASWFITFGGLRWFSPAYILLLKFLNIHQRITMPNQDY